MKSSLISISGQKVNSAAEKPSVFSARKRQHISASLSEDSQAKSLSQWSRVRLIHEAIPDFDLRDVDSSRELWGRQIPFPFFVSSMTGGHASLKINSCLAEACEMRKWPMGVGSQRRDLFDPQAAEEWRRLRRRYPRLTLFGNLGLTQVIESSPEEVQRLVDVLQAQAFFVHTNPLQEALQAEGTPRFKGSYRALERLVRHLSVPVIVKEVGCGFSFATLKRLESTGVKAVDLAGGGGTHWGRVEVLRASAKSLKARVGLQFFDWGGSTLDSLLEARQSRWSFEIWASGGIRTSVDAGKALALGASMVGVAQPFLRAALKNVRAVTDLMQEFEEGLRIVQFCTGSRHLEDLRTRGVCNEAGQL